MPLTADDLAAIKSSLESWELVEYVATAVVLLGVVGEYLAEFTEFSEKRGIAKKLGRLSTLVLIFGLAIELIALVRTSQLSDLVIASLEEQSGQAIRAASQADERAKTFESGIANADARAAEAGKQAAEANLLAKKYEADIADANARAKRAEAQVVSANAASQDAVARVATADARIAEAEARAAEANLALERFRSPRVINSGRLRDALRRFSGTSFDLAATTESEATDLTDKIEDALTAAGWALQEAGGVIKMTRPNRKGIGIVILTGITVSIDQGSRSSLLPAAEALIAALRAEGLADVKGEALTSGATPNIIHIKIGRKQ